MSVRPGIALGAGLLLVLAASGCYDFSELGPPGDDLSVADDAMPAPSDDGGHRPDDDDLDAAVRCGGLDDCPTGYNCVDKLCRAAVAGCAAHKSAWPTAGDGVYWISPDGTSRLAYCDMAQRTELCTTRQETHSGKTREGSKTAFTMTSVLAADGRSCDLWAVRASDGFPLGVWAKEYNAAMIKQCPALGFVDDIALSSCPYGSGGGSSNCGFPVVPLYAYGHECMNCMLNQGTFTQYTKMGPFTNGAALSSVDGTVRARCKTR
jgi:hypothetical protein